MPEVSVIIPCYNHGHYLPHAVNSVLAQTFTDWEAVIVDDGSTDNTRELAAQFTDPRIRYVYQKNRGLSAARNTGISASSGQFLAFLDADDEWESSFLEVCVEALKKNEVLAAVVTTAYYINETGARLNKLGLHITSPQRFRARLIEGGFFPVHAVLVRSGAIHQIGYFDESLTSVEDWDLWLRLTSAGGVMSSIPDPLARYRVSAFSMSTNARRMHVNRMAVLAKQFGTPTGDPKTWSDEKSRAYGFAYLGTALSYMMQDDGHGERPCLDETIRVCPRLLKRTEIYYELACGSQNRSVRGTASMLDIRDSERRIFEWLGHLNWPKDEGRSSHLQHKAYGAANLALAMLANQANEMKMSKAYLGRALRADPSLVANKYVVVQMLKHGISWIPGSRWQESNRVYDRSQS